jgi:cyclic pyranopterin phosphate synthase
MVRMRVKLTDPYGRSIRYLRISVTDRCNYRCVYCMPEEGVPLKKHADILSYEDITRITESAVKLGFDRVRLTGGEPLVRMKIEELVSMLASIGGLNEIAMTTNASLLTREKAQKLKDAGLSRINISLDTLDPARFEAITRGGKIDDVLAGIDAALEADLRPVKINMIVFEETTRDDIEGMHAFCGERGLVLQTIKQFSLYDREEDPGSDISCDRPQPCELCDKLRLTAEGYLLPCLFSNKEIRVDLDHIELSLRRAVAAKPQKGTRCSNRLMCQIGG